MARNPKSPNSTLIDAAARAIADITRYTFVPLENAAIDIAQHICDFKAATDAPPYFTTLPFLFMYSSSGSSYYLTDRTSSLEELDFLHRHLQLLPETVAGEEFLVPAAYPMQGTAPFPSFKLSTLGSHVTVIDLPLTKGESFIRALLPSEMADKNQFRAGQTEIKDILNSILSKPQTWGITPKISPSRERVNTPRLSETQSTFTFLEQSLGRIAASLKRYFNSTSQEKNEFHATFLFRTKARPSDRGPRYRYIFTDAQTPKLRETRINDLPGVHTGSLIEEIRAQISTYKAPDAREERSSATWLKAADYWLEHIGHYSVLDIMSQGEYYGSNSYINYIWKSAGKSLYITDWRAWYPRILWFRDQIELSTFSEWAEATIRTDNNSIIRSEANEPLARLLRSSIEEAMFGLKTMLMVPAPYIGNADPTEPVAVLQISSSEPISPALRIEAISQLIILAREVDNIVHAESLRDQLSRAEQLRHFVSIAHTFTHAGQKLFSTPITNSARRITSGLESGKLQGFDYLDRWALNDAEYSARLLEKHLGMLSTVSPGSSTGWSPPGRYTLQEEAAWDRLLHSCKETLSSSFMRSIWDVAHDSQYRYIERALAAGDLCPPTVVALRTSISRTCPRCNVHNNFLQLHVGSLIENAVESLDLREAIDNWQSENKPKKEIQIIVTASLKEEVQWVTIKCQSKTTLLKEEHQNLTCINTILRDLTDDEIDPFLEELRSQMDERRFTTKSGGGHGWALLNAASYLRRIELWRSQQLLVTGFMTISIPTDWTEQESEVSVSMNIPVRLAPEDRIFFLVK